MRWAVMVTASCVYSSKNDLLQLASCSCNMYAALGAGVSNNRGHLFGHQC